MSVGMPEQADEALRLIEDFNSWLKMLVSSEASDLHLKVGSPPMIRDQGRLRKLDYPVIKPPHMNILADYVIPPERRTKFTERGEVDFAHSAPGIGRFRVNTFRQRGSISAVFRKMGIGGSKFEDLGLPPILSKFADEPRGIVLVTGPTGCGKTTTLAAMIEHINNARSVHIVTIEDPIEIIHPDKEASINQREIGQDTEDFLTALRAAMRQDPDVILIGEMRDIETVRTALQAAETGHLVLSTLHTVDATETVNRIVDFFPPHQQKQVRLTLAGALRGVVCQRLVPKIGGGMIPAVEILVNTGRISDRIVDPTATAEIHDVVAEGGFYGMQTFDQALLVLVTSGQVEVKEALTASSNSHDFQLMLQQAGELQAGAAIA